MTNSERALIVAQRFNKEVLKNQLNPNGESIKKLADMIEDVLVDTCERVWNNAHEKYESQ